MDPSLVWVYLLCNTQSQSLFDKISSESLWLVSNQVIENVPNDNFSPGRCYCQDHIMLFSTWELEPCSTHDYELQDVT